MLKNQIKLITVNIITIKIPSNEEGFKLNNLKYTNLRSKAVTRDMDMSTDTYGIYTERENEKGI